MRRDIVRRSLLGIPCGIAFSYIVAIAISLYLRLGYFMPCPVSLPEVVGGEMNAVLLQTGFCGLVGAGFGAASMFWQIPGWKLSQKAIAFGSAVLPLLLPVVLFLTA